MISLKNKIAIVTGASRSTGIGTAICRSLARLGAHIFFTHWSRFDETEGNGGEKGWPDQLCKELEALGVRASHMEADLALPETPSLIMDQVEKSLGHASILINNAAYCVPTNFRDLNMETLDQHYNVNNRGTILLSTEFAKRFEQHHAKGTAGRIIFMVSKGPDPNNLAYIATKGALISLIEPLSVGLASLHITVNGFDPGPTDSGWMDDDMKAGFLPMFPMGRIGLPEDAAKAISFLASDESQWITGQVIKSEGGFLGK
ncbi:3-oxoacyl-[acyl-carrier protein] reductase [Paenibacillus castaneae]|uniref:SDR family oxidoreductase n=1 Tax=Paenibacillus castaneae TaxID=474957 RepID=UPI000C9C951E|nr:SDR family oxidoreductase [Paenibacillus castaneae]NIK79156.1 3-oxoacyl-[acyl-carrier protein] reductase [Paenibacillus castaneae]